MSKLNLAGNLIPKKKAIPGSTSKPKPKPEKNVAPKKAPKIEKERLTVDLPKDVYIALKTHCFQQSMYAKDYVANLVRRDLKL